MHANRLKQILNIENLTVSYRKEGKELEAIRNVSIDFPKGKITGLVGESGCGKTTLGRSIMRILPFGGRIVRGAIKFDGVNLMEKSEGEMRKVRGNRISMIFQDPSTALNPLYRIGHLLSESLELHKGVNRDEALRRGAQILRELVIPDPEETLRRYPFELSGGMKQRAMIAIAICTEPDLLIADEPTSNLDVTVEAQLLKLLHDLNLDFGASIIFISHNLAVIGEICDFVAVMYAGDIVEFGGVETVLRSPAHPYTQQLMKAAPQIKATKVLPKPIRGRLPDLASLPPGCKFHPRCDSCSDLCCKNDPPLKRLSNTHSVKCFSVE